VNSSSRRLRTERLNRGLSIRRAAKAIGLADWKVLQAAEHDRVPMPHNALKIASFYGHAVTAIWPVEPVSGEPPYQPSSDSEPPVRAA
jgi:hypothetical protein